MFCLNTYERFPPPCNGYTICFKANLTHFNEVVLVKYIGVINPYEPLIYQRQ